jgi:hypothetical protein
MDFQMHATIPSDHHGLKIVTHSDGIYFGLWRGRCHPVHGMSRQHQSLIIDSSGSEIFTEERHEHLAIDQRVRFRMGSDRLGIAAVACGVEPIEPPAPVEPIEPVAAIKDKTAKRK